MTTLPLSASEVRGIIGGKIVQLARVVKPQPPEGSFTVGIYHPTKVDRKGFEYPGDLCFVGSRKDCPQLTGFG